MQFIKRQRVLLLLILLVAALFRFVGLNWDQGFHLHPDERFLTMVGVAMQIPVSLGQYLDPAASPMNPANIGFQFYVYGVFPVILNKFLAVILGNNDYFGFALQGRAVSAFLDLINVFLVFLLACRLQVNYKFDKRIPYIAAFFYAIAVLPIQLAHYFTVDQFLNTFLLASLYFATNKKTLFLSAVSFGLALASKINAVFSLPLILYFVISQNKKYWHRYVLLYGVIFYIVVRLASPYYFHSTNFFDLTPNSQFAASLKTLQSFQTEKTGYPPGLQWIGKPKVIFSVMNVAFFGLGLGYFILLLRGISVVINQYLKKRVKFSSPVLIILLWVLLFFFYQSAQVVQSMRYFIPLYPFFAIFAAHGFSNLFNHKNNILKVTASGLIIASLIWPVAFYSIYLRKHSRVEASEWIYKNLQNNSIVLTEHWDDALPMPVKDNYRKQFFIKELQVFAPDTEEKWRQMNDLFSEGDYYILSSNRGWGSISQVPTVYPRMSKFYSDLFAGKTSFVKIKEFTSYPSLRYLGIPIDFPDEWAEEAFSVYDHPKVMIFEKR